MQLVGGTHFLILTRTGNGHEVSCHGRFRRALASWKPDSRVSPIYSVDDAPIPDLTKGTSYLLFLGPIHPGAIPTTPGCALYLTLGLLNVLAHGDTAEALEPLRLFAAANKIGWEQWTVSDGLIAHKEHSTPPTRTLPSDLLSPIYEKPSPLCSSGREYSVLMAETLSRAAAHTPTAAEELTRFDHVFRNSVIVAQTNTPVVLGHLVTTNAALSRYTSQTYAGTPPIVETECHYWSHSLLGIGTPSLALSRVRRFLERIVEENQLLARVAALECHPAFHTPIQSLAPSDAAWDQQPLDHAKVQEHASKRPTTTEPRIPVLTFFSGRDGFRATHLSLSAPLESLDSCNSIMWTLQTLTHEITHILVDAVLGILLPHPNNESQLDAAIRRMQSGFSGSNLLEQVQNLLCYALWRLDESHSGVTSSTIDASQLGAIIVRRWPELTELLTHCFDFLYFYRRDPDVYVKSVWSSWSVIPNIAHRTPDYIMRSLCALHTCNFRREKAAEVTMSQLEHALNETKLLLPTAHYVSGALEEINKNREFYLSSLQRRRLFSVFVRHFLFSSEIEKRFMKEPGLATGDHGGYGVRPLTFDDKRVENPLRFIHEVSRETQPSHLRSAWLLQQLAFGELP